MTTLTPDHSTSSVNFEIRIAVLGTPQAGNSTIINSILGSEYCPVGKKSACVNIFDIFSSNSPKDDGVDESPAKRHKSEEDLDHGNDGKKAESLDPTGPTQTIRSAKSVNKRIRKDNKKHKEEQVIVREKHHLIEPSSSPIFAQTSRREDTKLYVLDVPGLFRDDVSRKKFIPYVNNKWCTFDLVVVVLDVQDWMNNNDCNDSGSGIALKNPQVELLEFVEHNLTNQKRIPTIVVANKADSPIDETHHRSTLPAIKSLRDLSIDTFGVSCSRSTLTRVLSDYVRCSGGGGIDKKLLDCGPIFLPNSTQVDFSYKLEIPTSTTVDSGNDIGDGEGDNHKSNKKRKKDNTMESVTFASHEIVDPFTNVLRYFVDGEQAQTHLLSRQIDFQLESMKLSNNDPSSERIADNLEVLFHRCGVVGRTTTDFGKRFWKLYNSCEDIAKSELETTVDPRLFERPFQELEAYHAFAIRIDCSHTVQKTIVRMKELLRYQYNLIIRKQIDWSFVEFCRQTNHSKQKKVFRCSGGEHCDRCTGTNHCEQQLLIGVEGCQVGTYCGKALKVMGNTWTVPDQTTWTNLSPYDWNTILFSVLNLSPSEIYGHFGRELRTLKDAEYSFRSNHNPPHVTRQQLKRQQVEMEIYEDSISTMMMVANSSSPKMEKTTSTSTGPALAASASPSANAGLGALDKIPIPDDISDPSHWGYLSWKYITFYNRHVRG